MCVCVVIVVWFDGCARGLGSPRRPAWPLEYVRNAIAKALCGPGGFLRLPNCRSAWTSPQQGSITTATVRAINNKILSK